MFSCTSSSHRLRHGHADLPLLPVIARGIKRKARDRDDGGRPPSGSRTELRFSWSQRSITTPCRTSLHSRPDSRHAGLPGLPSPLRHRCGRLSAGFDKYSFSRPHRGSELTESVSGSRHDIRGSENIRTPLPPKRYLELVQELAMMLVLMEHRHSLLSQCYRVSFFSDSDDCSPSALRKRLPPPRTTATTILIFLESGSSCL